MTHDHRSPEDSDARTEARIAIVVSLAALAFSLGSVVIDIVFGGAA